MERLPILSGVEIIKILVAFGYKVIRQKGSHVRLVASNRCPVTVPDYKTIDRSLLKKILKQAGISQEDFIADVERVKSKAHFAFPSRGGNIGPIPDCPRTHKFTNNTTCW